MLCYVMLWMNTPEHQPGDCFLLRRAGGRGERQEGYSPQGGAAHIPHLSKFFRRAFTNRLKPLEVGMYPPGNPTWSVTCPPLVPDTHVL